MGKSNAVILPGHVRPISYELGLTPDFDRFTFRGEESVDIEVLEPTASIVLNCADIEVQSCSLTLADGAGLTSTDTSFNSDDETVTFRFDATLPTGPARLQIAYTGELNDKLRGFYRSRYTDVDGQERIMASTQFEATDARRAFPCWDEPALKARFQVALVIPSDMAAVSNMPAASEDAHGPGLKRVQFAETPVMSTYLLAFVIGDLRSIEQRADNGTLVRVWTTRGKEEQGRFALDVSVRLLEYFNRYFGIPYPLDKLDHLAIPDFAAGAMENWGAITYRETALLVDPQLSSAVTRQTVAAVVAHEMAHMWFGDLVTMAWWNDLWLNESFASWMGDKAVDHLYPEWQMWTQFIAGDTARALSFDGLKNSHPIEQEVKDPAEIVELFDVISYSKGGSILRMLEHFIGADAFQRGLRQYLSDHSYANARTQDLWAALGAASNQPVVAMMDSWVQQTGYPVLDVSFGRSQDRVEVSARQQRFLYEDVAGKRNSDDTLWRVPLAATTASGPNAHSILMDGRDALLQLTPDSDIQKNWVKINPEQTGFYRVNYPRDGWDGLASAVERLELQPPDRLGLQNDAYALSRAGLLPVTQFLGLASAYVNETDASVWSDLASNMDDLDGVLADEAYRDSFEAFALRVFQPPGGRVGWDAGPGEGHLDALMRSTVLAALGKYGDEGALSEASRRFAAMLEDSNSVRADIRAVVLTLAARRGDGSTYDTMWELYKDAPLQEEKVRLLRALAAYRQPQLLAQTLERSLGEDVRVHDTIDVVTGVGANRHGRDLAWDFLKSNWSEFDRRYGEGGFALMRLVHMTSEFATSEKLADVEEFFAQHAAPAAERTLRQSLEQIRLNIAWLDLNREELATWLAR